MAIRFTSVRTRGRRGGVAEPREAGWTGTKTDKGVDLMFRGCTYVVQDETSLYSGSFFPNSV